MRFSFRWYVGLASLLVAVTGLAAWNPSPGRAESGKYWIFFTDKGVQRADGVPAPCADGFRGKVQERWERAGWTGDSDDLPVNEGYVRKLAGEGIRVRRQSRWLNAVSAWLDDRQRESVVALPFVRDIRPVAVYRRPVDPSLPLDTDDGREAGGSGERAHRLKYGPSLRQFEMVQLPSLHDIGFRGAGVTVCVMDSGFRKDHRVFHTCLLTDEYDFVFDDDDTQDEPEDAPGAMGHGTGTWSLVGGRQDGKLIGGAFEADYLLAKTEDIRSEAVTEEDDWVAGLEWADERGVDIVNSSLGYYNWYAKEDFDGTTAITSVAAGKAAKRGILVVNSAGNRGTLGSESLVAPADAFGILAVGAVIPSGRISSFSSRGPTADGRTKPEVVAQGENVFSASWNSTNAYTRSYGTSYSCPITASAAAALLSARRDWSAAQLREAIMMTASRADSPDNDFGWGVVKILDAYRYLPKGVVVIDHTPLRDQPASAAGYTVRAEIRAEAGIAAGSAWVYYRLSGQSAFTRVALAAVSKSIYTAVIPAQPAGTTISYYLRANDRRGKTARRPYEAPRELYSFRVSSRTLHSP